VSPSQLRGVLARNIRQAAKRRRQSLNALADLAGVSRSQLYDVLARRKAASIDWIARIATALEIEPARLLATDT
jgi:lambda repressor-like predicted transcriptional regulator